jgi:hypothetical protein
MFRGGFEEWAQLGAGLVGFVSRWMGKVEIAICS